MMRLELNFQIASNQDCDIAAAEIEHWIKAALNYMPTPIAKRCEKIAVISLKIIDEAEMSQLNGQFRGKPSATNVLSFPSEIPDEFAQGYIGDIAICWPVVKREALSQKKSVRAHFAHLTIHGVLHCLGYDHVERPDAEKMEAIEIELLRQFNIANPYEETFDHESK